jgi:hypothetical protein
LVVVVVVVLVLVVWLGGKQRLQAIVPIRSLSRGGETGTFS